MKASLSCWIAPYLPASLRTTTEIHRHPVEAINILQTAMDERYTTRPFRGSVDLPAIVELRNVRMDAEDRVVGQVRSYIDSVENERWQRKRGWTEDISTAWEWRRRGVAGALICASLARLGERRMTEAALGVDT